MNKYYPGEPVNIYIQSLINIMDDKHLVITTKRGKGKLPLFCGNEEWVIPIYDVYHVRYISLWFKEFLSPLQSYITVNYDTLK